MFGLLFRSTLAELLKVLLVTTAVLVTVIAFGAAIKPLSENLLGPIDLVRYMLFATVPMLQFALPFAAAFAGVIVHHRMASDNEILAMATSGLSYRRILAPALVLGVLLTGVMFVLVDVGAPTFWQALRRIKASDLTRVLVAKVERGEGFKIGGTEIYADEAHVVDAPPDTGAQQRLVLVGVAAVELGPDALPRREFAARYATVDFHRIGNGSFLKLALQDASSYSRGDGSIAGATIVRPEAIDLGQSVEEGPKGLRFRELISLPDRLETFPPIVAGRDGLRRTLASADGWRRIEEALASQGRLTFTQPDGAAWTLEGATVVGNLLAASGDGPIRARQAERSGSGEQTRTDVTARQGSIQLTVSDPASPPRFDVILEDAQVVDRRGGGAGRRSLRLADLSFGEAPPDDRAAASNDRLLAEGRAVAAAFASGPSEAIRASAAAGAGELEAKIARVRAEVIARIVQRTAQMSTAILMLLFASMVAILLRHRPALLAYLIAFVPAIATILLISGGEQMLRDGTSAAGFVVAWSGNAGLLLACLVGWIILRRH